VNGPLDPVLVFAVCAPGKPSWQAGALIVVIALVFYVLPTTAAFITAVPGTRRWLGAVYLFAVGISVVFGLVIPGGLETRAPTILTSS
jgi:hypothetical protein